MLNRLKDVFRSFQQNEVRYIVIGGIASVLYGVQRAAFNLDDVRLLELSDSEEEA